MKRTYLTLIIMMLVIGFAAVATNLVINGTITIGFNEDDFSSNVVFSYTNTMHGDAKIIDEGKAITFKTSKLENVDQQAIMDFDIANKSSQYDASVTIECALEDEFVSYSEYIDINQNLGNEEFEIKSGGTESGRLTITLKKAYNESLEKDIDMLCTLIAVPGERTSEGIYKPVEHEYEEILLNGADPVLEAAPVDGVALAVETNEKKLIPVIIKQEDGTVTRADTKKEWYNYENKEWANAVILNDGVADPNVGEKINEDDIESYFVWIPKYKYKLFNMGNYTEITKEEYKEKSQEIEIKFGLENTSDEVVGECTTPMTSGNSGMCQVGEWMTHPAFISFNVNGFWIGKFETGYKQSDSYNISQWTKEGAQKDENNSKKVIIKPNVYSWRSITLKNAFNTSYYYQRNLDSHLIKNTEWGAVAYLSHSKYGTCDDGICDEIRMNNNSNYVTGYAAKVSPTSETSNALSADPMSDNLTDPIKATLNYMNKESTIASTTKNYTGIYDMSGGAWEVTMGALSSKDKTNYIFSDSGFSNSDIPFNNKNFSKYYDLYDYYTGVDHWNRRILGDATGELGPYIHTSIHLSSFYRDFAHFNGSGAPWFYRGSYIAEGTKTGIFAFGPNVGAVSMAFGFRIVLSPQ